MEDRGRRVSWACVNILVFSFHSVYFEYELDASFENRHRHQNIFSMSAKPLTSTNSISEHLWLRNEKKRMRNELSRDNHFLSLQVIANEWLAVLLFSLT